MFIKCITVFAAPLYMKPGKNACLLNIRSDLTTRITHVQLARNIHVGQVNIRTLHSYSMYTFTALSKINSQHTHMWYNIMFTLYKLRVQEGAHKTLQSYHSMLNLLLLDLTTWVRRPGLGDFLQEQLVPVLQLHTVRGRGAHAMRTVGHPPPHRVATCNPNLGNKELQLMLSFDLHFLQGSKILALLNYVFPLNFQETP